MLDIPIPPSNEIYEKNHEYSVVREEEEVLETNGCVRKIIRGYDSKGRLVEHGVFITNSDGSQSHVFKSVSSSGYWVGGFGCNDKDGNYVHGGTMQPEKFTEEQSPD